MDFSCLLIICQFSITVQRYVCRPDAAIPRNGEFGDTDFFSVDALPFRTFFVFLQRILIPKER